MLSRYAGSWLGGSPVDFSGAKIHQKKSGFFVSNLNYPKILLF
jgi:hypothetical protein